MMVPLGADAKQDSWIAILLGMMGGIVIFFIYVYLHRRFPQKPLTGYVNQILGSSLGFVVGLLYTLFFVYGAARDLRDGMELLRPAYNETPISVIGLLIMLVICYALYGGIEVLFRAGELCFLLTSFIIIAELVFLFSSDAIQPMNVLPVMEAGWKPVWMTTVTHTTMFPYGEMICFTMLLPFLKDMPSGLKIGIFGILLSGIVLSLITFLEISVLGAQKVAASTFPFLRLMQYVNIGGFIQRIDAFVIIHLIVNDFFKVALFAYAALIGAMDLFRVSRRILVFAITCIILFVSIAIAPDTPSHFAQGKFALKYIFPPFVLYIPLLLLMIEVFRKRAAEREKN